MTGFMMANVRLGEYMKIEPLIGESSLLAIQLSTSSWGWLP
jgi:hypothetical protein